MRALLGKNSARWLRRGKEEPGRCQVRSKTDHPCLRPAAVEIQGVPFCERCAREQQVYFAIGELTQEEKTQGFHNRLLAKVLGRVRRGRRGRVAAAETERAKVDGREARVAGSHTTGPGAYKELRPFFHV